MCIRDRDHPLPYQEFYAKMRSGSMPTTSQINPEEAKEKCRAFLKVHKQIIHIAFSSGLSGTCGSVAIAARELMEEDPECRITVIDSLAASLGQGLLDVYKRQAPGRFWRKSHTG